jgi:hypothetical protein
MNAPVRPYGSSKIFAVLVAADDEDEIPVLSKKSVRDIVKDNPLPPAPEMNLPNLEVGADRPVADEVAFQIQRFVAEIFDSPADDQIVATIFKHISLHACDRGAGRTSERRQQGQRGSLQRPHGIHEAICKRTCDPLLHMADPFQTEHLVPLRGGCQPLPDV